MKKLQVYPGSFAEYKDHLVYMQCGEIAVENLDDPDAVLLFFSTVQEAQKHLDELELENAVK